MIAPKDRYVMVGKVRTRYWCEGENGSTVLLIHGINSSIETWLPNLEVLCASHRVFAVDMLGHGRTDKPLEASYTINDLAQFVREFMKVVEIDRAHVVGQSLGGAVALRLTLRYPNVVERLGLVGSGGLGKEIGTALRTAAVPLLGELLVKPSPKPSEDALRMVVYDPRVMTPEMLRRDYEIQTLAGNQPAFFKALRANVDIFGQKESAYGPHIRNLSSIQKPTLVIWGRDDRLVPVTHAEVAAKGLPHAQLQIFEHCGHTPRLEYAAEFNRLVLEFLSDTIIL